MSNGTVDNRTFWSGLFISAEKDGEVLRVGEYRSAPINDFWAVLKDNAEYPSATGILESQQEALDWMVTSTFDTAHLAEEWVTDDGEFVSGCSTILGERD